MADVSIKELYQHDITRNALVLQAFLVLARRHFFLPGENDSRWYYYSKAAFANLCSGVTWLICALAIIQIKIEKLNVSLDEFVSALVSLGGQWFICIVTMARWRSVLQTGIELYDFRKFGEPPEFKKAAVTLRRLMMISYYFAIVTLLVYVCVPLLEVEKCVEYKKTHAIEDVCGLFFPMLPYMDVDRFPLKPIIMVLGALSLLIVIPVTATLPVVGYSLHLYIVVRLKQLRTEFEDGVEGGSISRAFLRKIVIHHQDILR